jgi:hypothetical protein
VGRIAAPAPHRAARVAAPRTVTLPITARHAPAVQRHDDGSLAERALRVAVAAGRSPWALLALLFAIIGYAVVQRRIDGGSKLAAPGRSSAPDDELIEL